MFVKGKLLLYVVIILSIVLLGFIFIFWKITAQTNPANQFPTDLPELKTQENPTEINSNALLDDRYIQLETKREKLRIVLDDTKAKLWGVALPTKQADIARDSLYRGYEILNMPPLRGYFTSEEEVNIEIEKIDFILQSLEKLRASLEL